MAPLSTKFLASGAGGCAAYPKAFAGRQVVKRNVRGNVAAVEVPNAVNEDVSVDDMYEKFKALLEQTPTRHRRNDVVRGTVISADRRGAYVDIGGKGAAFVPTDALTTVPISDAREILRPGQMREFTVTDDRKDEVQLAMNIKEKAVIWARMRQLQEEDVTVNGTVVSANRGGLLIEFMTHRGFVPNSHLGIMKDKEDMTGEVLPLKFIEVDEENGRIMFSCRRAQSEDRLSSYRVGDVVEGVVSSVTFYGAFLEIAPNVTGLLHISQISHDRVTNIEKVLSVGDRIKVMIISQDRERGRLALSTRKLEPTPGDMLKDPAVVFARAEEMASLFRIRVAAAEAAARDEEARLSAPVEAAEPEA